MSDRVSMNNVVPLSGRSVLDLPSGTKFLKIAPDTTRHLNFLPYVVGKGNPSCAPGKKHFERIYWRHENLVPGGGPVVCAAKTAGQPCAACDWRASLSDRSADPLVAKILKDTLPKARQLFNVEDARDPQSGCFLWDISYHNFMRPLEAHMKLYPENADERFFADETTPMTVTIYFEAARMGEGQPFPKAAGFKFEKIRSFGRRAMEGRLCLDDLIVLPDYDEIRDLLSPAEDARKSAHSPASPGVRPQEDLPHYTLPEQSRQERPQAPPQREEPLPKPTFATAPASPDHGKGAAVMFEGAVYTVTEQSHDGFLVLRDASGFGLSDDYRPHWSEVHLITPAPAPAPPKQRPEWLVPHGRVNVMGSDGESFEATISRVHPSGTKVMLFDETGEAERKDRAFPVELLSPVKKVETLPMDEADDWDEPAPVARPRTVAPRQAPADDGIPPRATLRQNGAGH